MTKTKSVEKSSADGTAAGGTIDGVRHEDRGIAAARAQAELIEMLARLVLAAVESEQKRDAAIDSPPIGSARPAPKEAGRTLAAGTRRGGGDGCLDAGVQRRRTEGSR